MGFETQEEAERWAENAELLAESRKEEKLLSATCRQFGSLAECRDPMKCTRKECGNV